VNINTNAYHSHDDPIFPESLADTLAEAREILAHSALQPSEKITGVALVPPQDTTLAEAGVLQAWFRVDTGTFVEWLHIDAEGNVNRADIVIASA